MIMRNLLGHDDESEIITIIARLKENKFNVLSYDNRSIKFEIVLKHINTIPIPMTRVQKIGYTLTRYNPSVNYHYYLKQTNNEAEDRRIKAEDGEIIWDIIAKIYGRRRILL